MRQVPEEKVINKNNNSSDRRKSLSSLFAIIFFDNISLTIGFPVLTFLCFDNRSTLFPIATAHSTRSFWYGLCNALPHFVAIGAAPFLSWLSDYCGRKKILLIGAFGAFFLCFFTALSIWLGNIVFLLLGAILAGFCARTEPVALAVVGDCTSDGNDYNCGRHKLTNMGYLQFYISVGAFLGPLFGGFLAQHFFNQFNFSLPYVVGSIVAVVTIFITWYRFKESYLWMPKRNLQRAPKGAQQHQQNRREQPAQFWCGLWRIIFQPQVIKLSLILVLTQISWRLYYQFVPPFAKMILHYSPNQIGIFIALIAVWLAFASWLGVRFLSVYFSIYSILRWACFAMGAGILLLLISYFLPFYAMKQALLWFSAMPMAMGDVIVYSVLTTLYSNAVSAHEQGAIMGVNYIIVSLVWALTGLGGGYMMAANVVLPFLVAALPLVILFFVARRLHP